MERMRPKKMIETHIELDMDEKTISLLKVTNGLSLKIVFSNAIDVKSTASKAKRIMNVNALISYSKKCEEMNNVADAIKAKRTAVLIDGRVKRA